MRLDLLGDGERLRPELALQHAPVLAAGAAALGRRLAGLVLAGEHATRQRAVGHDAEAVVLAGRQDLDLRQAVHGVVVGLADNGAVDRKRTRLKSSHYCASRLPSSSCKKHT